MENKEELEIFTRYGSAASDTMFDYPCDFFRLPHCKGIIAYRLQSKCAVIFGDPLCPVDELLELTRAFHDYCHKLHLQIIYINVSEKFAKIAKEFCPILMETCEELIFDPYKSPIIKNHKLEHKVDRIKKTLSFHEYLPFNEEIEKALLEIGIKWRNSKKGPRFHLGHLNFFKTTQGKRWFYVTESNHIISMAMLSHLDGQKGWLLKFFFTLPQAARGTSEFLMTSLLETLKNENCHFLTKGMLPKDCVGEIKGLSHFSSKALRHIYKMIRFLFRFKKRNQYWHKYYSKKLPAYLLFSNSKIGFNEIRALLKAIKIDF